jgi:hypothetical protein
MEEEDDFDIDDFLYEINSKKNNQFQQVNNFINNYDNNLTRNKSNNFFQNKSHKINNYNIPKGLDLNNINNEFEDNILNTNYNPVNFRYNQDFNPNYRFSDNNLFQSNTYNQKMSSGSIRFDLPYKYPSLNNLNTNRIFFSERKPKRIMKRIMNKNQNNILLKKEKERRIYKEEDDIKALDKEEINVNLRSILGKDKLLKNLNNEIENEKIERLINIKKLEKIRKRLERSSEFSLLKKVHAKRLPLPEAVDYLNAVQIVSRGDAAEDCPLLLFPILPIYR